MRWFYFFVASLIFFAASAGYAAQAVVVVPIRGTIDPATADFLENSLKRAHEMKAHAVIVELDTPGGLLTSVQSMAQAVSESKIPVIVYVTPAGASATSAGALLTLASHWAAMAPGTHIGAAHPVGQQGEDIKGTMGDKVLNDTAAFARGLAELRGRNVEIAEALVRKSKSLTSTEALQSRIVETIASSRDELLKFIDGKKTVVDKKEYPFQTASSELVFFEMTWGQKLLHFLANPNVSAILMSLGLLLIYLELSHPGITFAGIGGVLCLLIALMAFQVLPVRAGGATLVLLGFLLMVIEPFVTTKGILATGGVVSFVLGLLWLVDPSQSDIHVSANVWIPIAIGLGSAVMLIGFAAARTKKLMLQTRAKMGGGGVVGLEGYEGHVESVHSDHLSGKAVFRGEVWNVRSNDSLEVGQTVRAERVEGFTVWVKPKGKV